MHAVAIAEELEIDRVLCPRAGGVLSALGLCASERRRDTARTVMLSGEELTSERVAAEAGELICSQRAGLEGAEPRVTYELRYRGQAFELSVPGPPRPDPAELRERFEDAHEQRYGYREPAGGRRTGRHPRCDGRTGSRAETGGGGPGGRAQARRPACALRRRVGGGPGASRRPSRRNRGRRPGDLRASRDDLRPTRGLERPGRSRRDDRRLPPMSLDPITLQVLIGSLRAACEEMGAVLIRASHSANIKERRDCSTALFDAAGEMVMQAEHIPVHLGSMPEAVAAVIGLEQTPGASWVLNDPYRGGTHLPDITLVAPVFAGARLIGFAAARAHHADVGGPTAGGMPAASTELSEEGVVIPPTAADAGTLASSLRRCGSPLSGSPTCGLRLRPTGSGRRGWPSSPRSSELETLERGDGRDPRLLRAPHPCRPGRASGRRLRVGGRARGRRRRRAQGPPAAVEGNGQQASVCGSTSRAPTRRRPGISTARSR